MSGAVPLAETRFRHNEGDRVRVPKLNRLVGAILDLPGPPAILSLDGGDAETAGPYGYTVDGGSA